MDWEKFAVAARALDEAIAEAHKVDTWSLDPAIQEVAASLRRLCGHQGKDVKASCAWIAARTRVMRRLAAHG